MKKDADISKLETALYQLPDLQVVSFSQVKQTILKLISTARVMVLSIAIIALLIAMVGVVNTVLMSVLERKQEIGILKTMGAMPADIFRRVWTATLSLCCGGGVAGIGLALVFARLSDILVRRILPYAPGGELVAIDLRLCALTLGIILAVGLVSGVYPAWKAGRMRPLDAIRSEG